MLKRDPITGAVTTDALETRIASSGGYTYIGEAEPGTADTEAEWRISRIGSTGSTRWANKSASFGHVWESTPGNADYAGYTYV